MSGIPYGYCHCGCGQKAPVSEVNHASRGLVRGEPMRFVRGHSHRRPGRPSEVTEYLQCSIKASWDAAHRASRERRAQMREEAAAKSRTLEIQRYGMTARELYAAAMADPERQAYFARRAAEARAIMARVDAMLAEQVAPINVGNGKTRPAKRRARGPRIGVGRAVHGGD